MAEADLAHYHEEEYRIAINPAHPNHLMPSVKPTHRRVLDVGCGAGQTLAALREQYPHLINLGTLVGIDRNADAIRYGQRRWPYLLLHEGSADDKAYYHVTDTADSFSLVLSRVALPYMNIPVVLEEMARVLTSGGDLWLVVHTWRFVRNQWWISLKNLQWKHLAFMTYTVINGILFHMTGHVFRLMGKCESFQTELAMRRALHNAGFDTVNWTDKGTCAVVTAVRR